MYFYGWNADRWTTDWDVYIFKLYIKFDTLKKPGTLFHSLFIIIVSLHCLSRNFKLIYITVARGSTPNLKSSPKTSSIYYSSLWQLLCCYAHILKRKWMRKLISDTSLQLLENLAQHLCLSDARMLQHLPCVSPCWKLLTLVNTGL